MTVQQMDPAGLEQLRRLSTCVVASAIETFQVRLANSGFADSSIQCIFKNRLPLIGYAATARIRSAHHRRSATVTTMNARIGGITFSVFQRRALS
jgi:hypothetical protein